VCLAIRAAQRVVGQGENSGGDEDFHFEAAVVVEWK